MDNCGDKEDNSEIFSYLYRPKQERNKSKREQTRAMKRSENEMNQTTMEAQNGAIEPIVMDSTEALVEANDSRQEQSVDGGDIRKNGEKVTIAAVSYLNSVQFTYGIENSGLIDADLKLSTPAECSAMLRNGDVEIALIPTGALDSLEADGVDFRIVTSHCIGAIGAVRTVVMVSDEEPNKIERIWLDPHSQSSVKLLAHLCEHHFKISPKWMILNDMSRVEHPQDGDAFLLIGDKVFDHEGIFEYSYDLAEEWQRHTSLPFVFAVWCARESVPDEEVEALEEALTWGVERTFEALQKLRPEFEIEDGYRYLTESIDTLFDTQKREALRQFRASQSRITLSNER